MIAGNFTETLRSHGGSIPVDFLTRDQIERADEAEKAGLVQWQSGGWGNSDYFVLAKKSRWPTSRRFWTMVSLVAMTLSGLVIAVTDFY